MNPAIGQPYIYQCEAARCIAKTRNLVGFPKDVRVHPACRVREATDYVLEGILVESAGDITRRDISQNDVYRAATLRMLALEEKERRTK